jgi:DNA-directed RNA polymerase subunit RPC12/RpoP/tetratricopeptide (TPR) repeat protein
VVVTAQDKALAVLCVERGLLDDAAIDRARLAHAEALESGGAPPLGQLLVQGGFLNPRLASDLLRELALSAYKCNKCSRTWTYEDLAKLGRYRCDTCGERLIRLLRSPTGRPSSTSRPQMVEATKTEAGPGRIARGSSMMRVGSDAIPSPVMQAAPSALRTTPGLNGDGVLQPGMQIGPYQIMNELGRGAMGVVYLARRPGLERLFAVKLLLGGLLADQEAVERFRREAALASRIQHPSIVSVCDVGVVNGLHYYVMDYCAGRTLKAVFQEKKRYPWEEAVKLVLEISRGVAAAHALGIVHRDVKPANVIMDGKTGSPKIMDFGLARDSASSEVGMTRTGDIVGTPSYSAPEQLTGKKDVDARIDVYALGVILYELISGVRPHVADTVAHLAAMVLTEQAKPLRERVPEVPVTLEAIVSKATAKRADDRYRTAKELADDLERLIMGQPVTARAEGALARFWRRRKRVVAGTLVSGAVIVVVFATLLARRLHDAEAQARKDLALLERNALGRAVVAEIGSAYGTLLASSPGSVAPEIELSWAAFAARRQLPDVSVEHARPYLGLPPPQGLEAKRLVADGLCRLGKDTEAAALVDELQHGSDPVLQDWARLRRFLGRREALPADVKDARDRVLGGKDPCSFVLAAEVAALDDDPNTEGKALTRALELTQDDVRALILQAALQRSGKTIVEVRDKDKDALARADLDAVMRIGSPEIGRAPLVAYVRGVSELAEFRLSEAIADLDVALSGGVATPELFAFRGWFEDEAGRAARKRADGLLKDRAAAFRPGLADEAQLLACLTPAAERRLQALAIGAVAPSRAPLSEAILASARGEPFEKVKDLFDRVSQVAGSDPVVLRERARFLLSRGRLPEVARLVGDYSGTDPELLLVDMEAMRRRGRYEDAYDLALRVKTLDPEGKCGLLAASYMALIDGDPQTAVARAGEAMKKAPDDGWARAAHADLLSDETAALDEARAALALQGKLDLETFVVYVKAKLATMPMPGRGRRGGWRGDRGPGGGEEMRQRFAQMRDVVDGIVRDSPSTDHFLFRARISREEDQQQFLEAATKADPGSPLVEEAFGYGALTDMNGNDLMSFFQGGELHLPGLPTARQHFTAAREIDPRWWMTHMPSFPIPNEYRSAALPILHKLIQPIETEFARNRR